MDSRTTRCVGGSRGHRVSLRTEGSEGCRSGAKPRSSRIAATCSRADAGEVGAAPRRRARSWPHSAPARRASARGWGWYGRSRTPGPPRGRRTRRHRVRRRCSRRATRADRGPRARPGTWPRALGRPGPRGARTVLGCSRVSRTSADWVNGPACPCSVSRIASGEADSGRGAMPARGPSGPVGEDLRPSLFFTVPSVLKGGQRPARRCGTSGRCLPQVQALCHGGEGLLSKGDAMKQHQLAPAQGLEDSPVPAQPGSPWLMLALATVGFAVNFWAWALLSPLGPLFRDTAAPGRAQRVEVALMVAVPVIVGSLGADPGGRADRQVRRPGDVPARLGWRPIVPVLFLGFFGQSAPASLLLVGGFFLGIARDVVRGRRAVRERLVPAGAARPRDRHLRRRHGRHRDQRPDHGQARTTDVGDGGAVPAHRRPCWPCTRWSPGCSCATRPAGSCPPSR